MKPNLRIKFQNIATRSKTRHLSVAHEKIEARQSKVRTEELKSAVKYCKDNNCRGYAAIATGLFPLVKDPKTINSRLDVPQNEIIFSQGNAHLRVLTFDEENKLVKYLKNKNR